MVLVKKAGILLCCFGFVCHIVAFPHVLADDVMQRRCILPQQMAVVVCCLEKP